MVLADTPISHGWRSTASHCPEGIGETNGPQGKKGRLFWQSRLRSGGYSVEWRSTPLRSGPAHAVGQNVVHVILCRVLRDLKLGCICLLNHDCAVSSREYIRLFNGRDRSRLLPAPMLPKRIRPSSSRGRPNCITSVPD